MKLVIAQQFFLLLLAEILNVLSIIILVYVKRKNPIKEFYFLIAATILISLAYLFYIINAYYSEPDLFDSSTEQLVRIAYFLSIIGIFLISYAFLLIDFEPNHNFLFKMSILTAVSISSAFYNAQFIYFKIINNYIEFHYTDWGFLLIVLFYLANAYIWINRVATIYKMTSKDQLPTNKKPHFIVWFILFCIITVIIYLMSIYFFDTGNTITDILPSVLILLFIIGLLYDDTFPFLTNLRLDGVIIYENQTAIKLFSKIYNNEMDDDESLLISSLFSTLNLSLAETLKSKKKLSQLYFEDKIVLISTGKYVTTLVIVGSKTNFISKAITQQITTIFEKLYAKIISRHLTQKQFTFKTSDFSNFEPEMKYFKKYFPM